MDAQELFRQGVLAIRDQHDMALGRQLLTQSLQLDPHNDMAWLWMTHVVASPQQRLECVERALRINPANQHALALKERLLPQHTTAPRRAGNVIRPLGAPPGEPARSPGQDQHIKLLLGRAEVYLDQQDIPAAIEQWKQVLDLQPDHPAAIGLAIKYLWSLNRTGEARRLIWRALDSGTTDPSLYLTAIDIAERDRDHDQANALRARVLSLPHADAKLILAVANQYIKTYRFEEALRLLQHGIEIYPQNQDILVKLGDLYQQTGHSREAMRFYEQAARLKPRTKTGREADKRLLGFAPLLTDQERGSIWLAVREALGIGLVYLLMGWQDAGLNLLMMGPFRWLGVGLGLVGGYMLVTATSSPQQAPLAAWFGGKVPDHAVLISHERGSPDNPLASERTELPILPEVVRYFLGIMGAALLVVAFMLVFNQAIELLIHYEAPFVPDF